MRSISPRRLAWIARCERRIWHDFHSNPADHVELTLEAQERAAAGEAHSAALADAVAHARPIPPGSPASQLAATLELMAQGVPAIRGAVLAAELAPALQLCGPTDLLLRRPAPSALGAWSYAPVLIKLHAEPRREDWLQLDACRQLVASAQDSLPAGELWLGQDRVGPQRRLTTGRALDGLREAWQRIEALIEQPEAPALWFERSCIFCPWRAVCQESSQAALDLAVLPGLERHTATALRAAGIGSLADLAALTQKQLQTLKSAERPRPALLLRAQALVEERALPLASPAAALPAPTLCFDVEAYPTTQQPWALGWTTAQGASTIALVAAGQVESNPVVIEGVRFLMAGSLAEAFRLLAQAAAPDGVIGHWGEYERTLLRNAAPEPIRSTLLPRLHDAHQLLLKSYALPLARTPTQQGGSLKAVGSWLGVNWPLEANHWRIAWRAFQRWQTTGDPGTLLPVAQYLGSDLRALLRVYQWLHEQ